MKSRLGGNLRLRLPNELKPAHDLKKATGKNPNPFYQTFPTPAPIIADSTLINPPELKTTFVYDLPTNPGQVYTFDFKE